MKSTRFLLFGAQGQVGWELQRSLALLGEVLPLDRAEVELADPAAVRATIRELRPAAIVNAGAYTAVDKAESDAEQAMAINAGAPAVMAEEARRAGVPLVHYSTDYVYDGAKATAYVESDPPKPLSVYGSSKLAGDEAIMASGADCLILRTTWVFGAWGGNFLKTILRLASERDSLRIVADQIGAPTSAELIADATAHALRALLAGRAPAGLYHLAAAGETSWHGYAQTIAGEALALGLDIRATPERIAPIRTEEYPLPATRPKNSRLDCGKFEDTFDLDLPSWQTHVKRTLMEIARK